MCDLDLLSLIVTAGLCHFGCHLVSFSSWSIFQHLDRSLPPLDSISLTRQGDDMCGART
jgi:hypothetical protein